MMTETFFAYKHKEKIYHCNILVKPPFPTCKMFIAKVQLLIIYDNIVQLNNRLETLHAHFKIL